MVLKALLAMRPGLHHLQPKVLLTAGIIVADVVGAGILAMPLVLGSGEVP